MSAAPPRNPPMASEREFLKRGMGLLSQQIWCWGRDILRDEGNWLMGVGFQRLEPPADRDNCSSVYSLEQLEGRRVVLRGFGVFYGDDRLGGVFLPRFEFRPKLTPGPALACPPWSGDELPKLSTPNDSQRDACVSLTVGLFDWIGDYEATVAEGLGTEYRQSTIDRWSKSKGSLLPAGEMVTAWRSLAAAAGENPDWLLP